MAGPRSSFSESFPYSAIMVMTPPGVPGVTAASGPYSGGCFMFFDLKKSAVAPLGATPSALIPMTLCVCGL